MLSPSQGEKGALFWGAKRGSLFSGLARDRD